MPAAGHQWRRRPILSGLVRVAVFTAPAAAGIGTALLLRRLLPQPTSTPQTLLEVLATGLAMLGTVIAVERGGRRLLPLAALLNLSLLFPDRAPRRFAVARRVGRPRDLQRQLHEARERGAVAGGEVAYMQTVLELVAALSVHDKQTRGHSERVRIFADMIGDELKLPPSARARLRWASLLHDIGKLLVPSQVLTKPSALNDTEWARVRRHPEEGARLVDPLRPWLGDWAQAVEHHHERWDGKGYPFGLAGEEISLAGRIVGVADAYEVMTAVRPYRRPIGVAAAREELVRCAGKQFDPAVVRAFLNISVGRLWRVVGMGSWVAQLPLLGWLNGLGLQAGNAVVSGTTALGLTMLGVPPSPLAAPHTLVARASEAPPGPGGRGNPASPGVALPAASTGVTGGAESGTSAAAHSTAAPPRPAIGVVPSAVPGPTGAGPTAGGAATVSPGPSPPGSPVPLPVPPLPVSVPVPLPAPLPVSIPVPRPVPLPAPLPLPPRISTPATPTVPLLPAGPHAG